MSDFQYFAYMYELSSMLYYDFFFFFKQKTAYEMLRSLVGSEMCIRDSPHPNDRSQAGTGSVPERKLRQIRAGRPSNDPGGVRHHAHVRALHAVGPRGAAR
eukprot:TRINITY_DN16427_c0_g1_i4.p1 TRINITY_DN16427_c0_g1~~TRINITY_DN16427_c0_g1_i4.p1  ORF type:complete len:101 (+),score=21.13 TRINITY_DN16427_c0_g1_i4:70-372(+)